MNTMRQVMLKAWEIAREGQKKFGGKVSEYMPEALRMAWGIVKKEANEMKRWENVQTFVKSNEWKNYGKHRLYIDAGIHLIEKKETPSGTVADVLRRVEGTWYYDFNEKKMYKQRVNAKGGLATAHEEVIQFINGEIKKLIWGEVAKYEQSA